MVHNKLSMLLELLVVFSGVGQSGVKIVGQLCYERQLSVFTATGVSFKR